MGTILSKLLTDHLGAVDMPGTARLCQITRRIVLSEHPLQCHLSKAARRRPRMLPAAGRRSRLAANPHAPPAPLRVHGAARARHLRSVAADGAAPQPEGSTTMTNTKDSPAPRPLSAEELRAVAGGGILICIEHKRQLICTIQ
jgi:hypothetical protein